MRKRLFILSGMVLGLAWAVAIVAVPLGMGLPFLPAPLGLALGFIAPGLVLAAMIAVLAARRFMDSDLVDGADPLPATAAQRDQAVLTNTVEQLVLAAVLWPFVAQTLGGAVVVAMGLGFAAARLLFWLGYHIWPPLRALGFAATFYPSVVAAIWAFAAWMG